VARFRSGAAQLGLQLPVSSTPIQPLVLGREADALAASETLRDAGLWVPAIRPPTVPAGSSRLRITFSAAHQAADVDRLLEALATLPRNVLESAPA
jgi:8-amino-7-oxononanoate synthase